MLFSKLLSKNYATELTLLRKYRRISDGISFVEFNIETSWYYGDHQPSFTMFLSIFNLIIFEFNIYNINHVEDKDVT